MRSASVVVLLSVVTMATLRSYVNNKLHFRPNSHLGQLIDWQQLDSVGESGSQSLTF